MDTLQQIPDLYWWGTTVVFLFGWWLGRYSRDLYWTSKAWPSPYPTQACARGQLYWVANTASPEDCDKLLKVLENERTERERLRRDGRAWATLLALCVALIGCAADGDEPGSHIDGLPLYVHLCTAMPEADKDAWGAAAGDINAARPEAVLWVGHGEPIGCATVDVCSSSAVERVETRIGACVITLRYPPGTAAEVAGPELARLVAHWEAP